MIEVRMHGRGGQGVVASAEMLAVSAIRDGKYAQAFPSFGPERRGAPVVAFCRVDDHTIITREPISVPDVVVVLDPTVLRAVQATAGLKPGGKLVVNTCLRPEELARDLGVGGCTVATVDANRIALQFIGQAITNTAMLGALLKVEPVASLEVLYGLLRERFPAVADMNIQALQAAYDETSVAEFVMGDIVMGDKRKKLVTDLPTWRTIDHACIVFEPGSSVQYYTGDWRSMRPDWNSEKCVKCGKCWMYCPEAAINVDEHRDYKVDYDYCKGCGICAEECPYGVIVMVEECE